MYIELITPYLLVYVPPAVRKTPLIICTVTRRELPDLRPADEEN